ncbi:hypothetical protein GLOIN_2v1790588 [Rhizophagus irregularis DAOM 181602=DAOM 197198]|nr:hypothetical protein GLOIN_2v1790588 [Rhizophagus irregularis DAOM 181602=DAOM 197198]
MSTSTPIPVYTPSEPTGPPPAHLANEEDDDELVRILKAHANLLTTRGRLTVDSEIQEANNQIKHIINILMYRCKAKHEELGITKDLLVFAQGKINAFDETFTNLERQLVIIRAANDNFIEENHNLQRDYDTMVELRRRAIGERNQARHERNVLQADYTQAVMDRNEAQNAVNRGNILLNHWRLRATRTGGQLVLVNAQLGQVNVQLAHANNRTIEPSSTSFKQSTRDDMATTAIGLPIFEGKATDDIDTFVRLYMGYLDTINLNPYAAGGPPESWKRAMGILRSCMAGEAAEWFDREITGKNWELSSINSAGGANLAAFVALVIPEGAGGPNAGTYVNGSEAQIYSRDINNALATIRATFIPTHDLIGGDKAWGRAGARPTDRVAPATADAGVAAANNHPIVFPGIKPNQALYWLRTQFPTILDEKKRIRFNSLYQENEPVDAFYRTVKRAGKLLKLTDDLIIDQFFRGLSADNIFEAERFSNLNPDDLVKHLRNLERRRAEMRLGLQDRNRRLQADYSDVTQPPLGKQEPVVLTSKSSGVTQEQLQKLLKAQAEELTKNFQVQFKQLQARPVRNPPVYRQQIKPVRPKPQRRVVQDPQDPDWDDGYVDHDVGDDPDAPEWTLDDHQNAIDLIMGYKRGTSKILTKQLQKAKDKRDDLDLARAMRNLDLNDDTMDIDTASFGEKSSPNKTAVSSSSVPLKGKATPVKIPVKVTGSKFTPAKAVTKNDLLSLLRSADFRKLLREILQEELLSARKVTEIPEDLVEEEQEEDIRVDDPMDIDIARLENTKDLLALDGEVNGIAIQCLADTCANASFIQREAAEELGLDIDKSITYNISGASGTGRTFGMVKGVTIKLTPDYAITEDLAVLSGYKHREIGLSRTCLKRYNYDVHESREHIAFTCDGKNVFIPIVPDANRGDKK